LEDWVGGTTYFIELASLSSAPRFELYDIRRYEVSDGCTYECQKRKGRAYENGLWQYRASSLG
jgi:hypothetical protein